MRPKRTEDEKRRIGTPTVDERLDTLEEIVKELMSTLPVDKRKSFEDMQEKMDKLDLDFPE